MQPVLVLDHATLLTVTPSAASYGAQSHVYFVTDPTTSMRLCGVVDWLLGLSTNARSI